MKIKNIEHAIKVFETKAVKHAISTKNGESSKKINYHYNGIIDSVKWLYKSGELIKLSKFYHSPDFNVRSWAASFLLEIDTKNAERVLEELVKVNYADAGYILMNWRNGTFNMDFYKT